MSEEQEHNPEAEADFQFKPVIELDPVEVKTLEDDEEEVFKMRARLYRYDNVSIEWKERGVGDIRMLKHKKSSQIRLLMRREKVLKICCNHYITKNMNLKPHSTSDRSFVWTSLADFADEETKQETLAIRFKDAENAQKFKSKFEELQAQLPDEKENMPAEIKDDKPADNSSKETTGDGDNETTGDGDKETTDDVASKLEELSVNVKDKPGND